MEARQPRYGFDFSRNIGTSLEVHGEFALIDHFKKVLVDANGNVIQRTYDAVNYVLGLRYLSALNTTYILEYYYQGTGYSPRQMYNFFSFVDTGVQRLCLNRGYPRYRQGRIRSPGHPGKLRDAYTRNQLSLSQGEPAGTV